MSRYGTQKMRLVFGIKIAAAATAGMLLLSPAQPQSLSASAHNSTDSGAQNEIKRLRQELSALEGRVHELEKKAEDVKNDTDDDAQAKKLEQRFAAIERAQAKLEKEQENANANANGSAHAAGSHVTAPFVVYDEDNHVIFRVGHDKDNELEAVLGNELGPHVELGTAADRSFARFFRRQGSVGAQILATERVGYVLAHTSGGQNAVLGGGANDQFGVTVSHGETTMAYFGAKEATKGYLELNDASGRKMVEAGSLKSGKGYVLASPYRSSVDPRGNPSVLQGGAGR